MMGRISRWSRWYLDGRHGLEAWSVFNKEYEGKGGNRQAGRLRGTSGPTWKMGKDAE